MSPKPFDSIDAFRSAFSNGLEGLLSDDSGLGAYILAFNNAAFDAALRSELETALKRRFNIFSNSFQDALKRGSDPLEPPDDIAVFLRMMAVGYGNLAHVALRQVGPWELQFNPVRGFRPARSAGERPQTLQVPFNSSGFHFNKPFLRPETFWSGRSHGRQLDLLFNKFPFVELQTILVPDRQAQASQFLTRADHALAWSLATELDPVMPGALIGYNSLGAFASINHLHFHLTPRQHPLAITDPCWRHNGGSVDYPIDCQVADHEEDAWRIIDTLQRRDQSFNLLYTGQRIYCIARRRQGDYCLPDWCVGQAWYELGGGLICFDIDHFNNLTENTIRQTMSLAAPHTKIS